MMPDDFFQKEIAFLNEFDHFAKSNNIRVTVIREGYAEAVFQADERHLNGLGVVQGGVLYTLADIAFAGAVNSYGEKAIGMNSAIHYLRPGTGTSFRAVANVIHKGKATGVFSVDVFDSRDRLICRTTLTGMYLGKPFFAEEAISKVNTKMI